MKLDVTVKNGATVVLTAMAARNDAAVMAGLRRSAKIVQNMAVRQARKIDARPVPTRSQVNAYNRKGGGKRPKRVGGQGRKAWERTGATVRAIEAEPVEKTGEISIQADVPYGKSRHQLAGEDWAGMKGWKPQNPALGIERKNQWAKEAVDMTEPQVGPAFEATYLRELKRGS